MMARWEYDREANRLLREFAKVYDFTGPAGGHRTEEARKASRAITEHADRNWNPEWSKRGA